MDEGAACCFFLVDDRTIRNPEPKAKNTKHHSSEVPSFLVLLCIFPPSHARSAVGFGVLAQSVFDTNIADAIHGIIICPE